MKLFKLSLVALVVSTLVGCNSSSSNNDDTTSEEKKYVVPSIDFTAADDGQVVTVETSDYSFTIDRDQIKLAAFDKSGNKLAGNFSSRGIHFQGSNLGEYNVVYCQAENLENEIDYLVPECDLQEADQSEQKHLHFVIENDKNFLADLFVYPQKNAIRLSINLRNVVVGSRDLALLFSELPDSPVYGFGDMGIKGNMMGSVGDSAIEVKGDGHHDRFVSSFGIMPEHNFGFAQLVSGEERYEPEAYGLVEVSPDKLKLHAFGVDQSKYNYLFIGDNPQEVYKAFSEAKKESGFPDVQPYVEAFGVGWEAWPSLGYNTNQEAVIEDLQAFIDEGYPMRWGVIGSGFWERHGTTTTFGRWNEADYPDPEGMIDWFHDNGLKIMFGLRPNFSVYHPEAAEAETNGYAVTNSDGEPAIFASWEYPKDQPLYMLDAFNQDALAWWRDKTALWGVDGWKEDTMISATPVVPEAQVTPYHDGFANSSMKVLHDRGDIVMARNAYMSSPGSMQRLNDTFGEQLRIPQLVLAYGASAAPNVYTDGIGNASSECAYLTRHTLLSAVTATMAFGKKPWTCSELEEQTMKKAALWHQTYLPTIHSAAVKAFQTGYPYTATPLTIAYPDNPKVRTLYEQNMWQWLIGESLLAHPVFGSELCIGNGEEEECSYGYIQDVYLPEGRWIDFNTGEIYDVDALGDTIKNYDHGQQRIPVFVGNKGILITQDEHEEKFSAEVWPVKPDGESDDFQYFHHNGDTLTLITNESLRDNLSAAIVTNLTTNQQMETAIKNVGNTEVLIFDITPGHDYLIK
ncbi:TIM-barrel domain-containing protein [Photobacterium sanctipauli]|nr:TIM-barrel domain-containing protein [Photobacterium sanctipauli]